MHFHCRITSGQGRLNNNSTDCKIIGRSLITGNNTKVIYVFGCVLPDSLPLERGIFTLITSSKAQQPPSALKAGPTGGQTVTRFKRCGLTILISAAKPAPCSHGSASLRRRESALRHTSWKTQLCRELGTPPCCRYCWFLLQHTLPSPTRILEYACLEGRSYWSLIWIVLAVSRTCHLFSVYSASGFSVSVLRLLMID